MLCVGKCSRSVQCVGVPEVCVKFTRLADQGPSGAPRRGFRFPLWPGGRDFSAAELGLTARQPWARRKMTDLAKIVVGVGDMKVSADPSAYLITYSLGSCVGVVGHDPMAQVAGLLHFQLPTAKGHDARAAQSPAMFGDMGIPLLLDTLLAHGCRRDRIVMRVFGGASMLNDNDLFKIGIKNARAAKKILWQSCISIRNEDLGGEDSRTVSVEVGSGRVVLKKQTGEISF